MVQSFRIFSQSKQQNDGITAKTHESSSLKVTSDDGETPSKRRKTQGGTSVRSQPSSDSSSGEEEVIEESSSKKEDDGKIVCFTTIPYHKTSVGV